MLQRIQTLYLVFALAACIAALLFDWVIYLQDEQVTSFMDTSLAVLVHVLTLASALAVGAALLRYKNRKSQMLLVKLAALDVVLMLVAFSYVHYQNIESFKQAGDVLMSYDLGTAFPIIAIVLLWMAHRAIKMDDDLVKSVDRLR